MLFRSVPAGADAPVFSFQWHITDACDQRCRHCYIYAGKPDRVPESMDWGDMLRVLDNIRAFCADFGYRPMLFITGGDPILHPDFWRLLETLHRLGIPFVIMGNPFHLTWLACLRLKRLGCARYQLSLDGVEATHDALRRPGSWRATLDALKTLRRAGLTSVVMTTVSGANVKELPEILDTVVTAKADIFSFARYCEAGDAPLERMAPETWRAALAACEARMQEHKAKGARTRLDRKDHLWALLDYEQGRLALPEGEERRVIQGGCHCGISHLTILPNGDVTACRRVPDSRVGSALTDRLRDIWLGPMDAYRQYDRFERCAGCRLLAWCRGCPAVAASAEGRFYAPDPQCWHRVP